MRTTSYFGTNGVRGTFDVLTPELALRLAQAIGLYFKRGRILVGRDHRLTGDTLRHSVLAGLMSVGCDVSDLGVVSSPTAEFAARHQKADGLIIITASHNPPEWNALKVVDGRGVTVSRERGEAIEKLMGKNPRAPWDKVGHVFPYTSATSEHLQGILGFLNARNFRKNFLAVEFANSNTIKKIQEAKLRVVLDCGNGTATLIAPELFRQLGCEVIPINSHADGRFPGRPSEPSEANVQDLIRTVTAAHAHVGMAWDGDGDRLILVDENGRYIIGDRVFALCLVRELQHRKGLVVTTVATSRMIEDIARSNGCPIHYTKIGAPYLSGAVAEKNALLAGEEVGGVIWPEFSLAKDGFLTAAKALEAIAEKPLGAWMGELPAYFNVKRRLDAPGSAKKAMVDRVRAHAKKNKLDFTDIDGVRVNFPDGWVIVRPSGTENYVRVFAEAKTEAQASEMADEFESIAKVGLNVKRRTF